MRRLLRFSTRVLDHPLTHLTVGVTMALGAIFDLSETALERVLTGSIGIQLRVHHGMLVFGIVSAARALHEIIEGLLFVGLDEAIEHRREGVTETAGKSGGPGRP